MPSLNPVKRPKLVAGAVAAIAAVGVWFGLKLSDLNFGAGGGGGVGLGGSSPGELARPDSRTDDLAKDQKARDQKKDDAKKAAGARRGDVLEVVVDGRGYALRQTGEEKDEYVPTTLNDIVALAKSAPGNRDGVRVRVYRRGSALPTAEETLQRALDEAGIAGGAVQMMDGQLD